MDKTAASNPAQIIGSSIGVIDSDMTSSAAFIGFFFPLCSSKVVLGDSSN